MKFFLAFLLVGVVSCEELQPQPPNPDPNQVGVVPASLVQEAELLDEEEFKKIMHDEDALLSMMAKADPKQVKQGVALVNNMIKKANAEATTLKRIKKLFNSLGKGGNSALYQPRERALTKNKLIAQGVTVGKEWRLSFQVKQTGRVGNWGSLVHFTKGTDGSRLPGIWFYPNSNRLYMCMWTQRTTDDCYAGPHLAYNKWHTVVMEQKKQANGKYQIAYIIDGKKTGTKYQGKPQKFTNLKVYSSDPWYSAPKARIRNIDMENL